MSVIENYSICPIVFNVYERLKTEIWRKLMYENIIGGSPA